MNRPSTLIRCSSLDRVLACAGSLVPTDSAYTPNNPEAREGTAAHEVLTGLPRGVDPDFVAAADKHRVDVDTLTRLYGRGREAWAAVQQWFKGERHADNLTMAAELGDGVTLRGTPDLLSVQADSYLAILDFKTGWAPSEHTNQIRGYAYLAREKYGMPSSGYILGIEIWVRVGEYRVHRFTDAQLDALRTDVLKAVSQQATQYGPGETACKYCPRQTSCPALEAFTRSGVQALMPLAENQPVTPDIIGRLLDERKAAGKALARFDSVMNTLLDAGVAIPLPNGMKLVRDYEEQDSIVPSLAQPLIEELEPTAAELDELVKMSKTGLAEVLKGRAPARQGAAYMRTAMKKLEALGAVKKVTRRTTKVVA